MGKKQKKATKYMDSITEAVGAGTVIRFESLGQGGIILEKVYLCGRSESTLN